MSPIPDGTKVGDAYVSIDADVDLSALDARARMAAERFGIGFGKELNLAAKVDVDVDRDLFARTATRAGANFSVTLADAIQKSFMPLLASFPGHVAELLATPLGPAIVAIAAPIIGLAGVTLGASLGAGVVAGLTLAGVGSGIALSLMNPQVQAAGKEFTDSLLAQLGQATVGFKAELIGTFGLLREAMSQIEFGQFFGQLAPIVSLFGETFKSLAPAIDLILQKMAFLAEPMGIAIAQFLEKFIPAIDRFMDNLGQSMPGIISAFTFLGNVIIATTDFFGDFIAQASHMFAVVVAGGANLLDFLASWVDSLGNVGKVLGINSDQLRGMSANMRESLTVTGGLTTQFGELTNSGLIPMTDATKAATFSQSELQRAMNAGQQGAIDLNEAMEAYNQTRLRLIQTDTQGTQALSLNTEAGLRNRDMLEQAAQKSRDLAIQELLTGATLEQVTANHNRRIDALINENFKSAETREQARLLAAQYGQIPKDVATQLHLLGVADVEGKLNDLKVKQVALWKNISVAEAKRNIEKGQYAAGGYVTGPGTKTSDSIDARLSNGEFVMQAAAVDKYGVNAMHALNQGAVEKFAQGGPVGTTWPFPVDISQTMVNDTWAKVGIAAAGGIKGIAGSVGGALGGYQGMFAWLQSQVPGVRLQSGYRPGSMAGGGYDYHHYGRAVDVGPSPGSIANAVVSAIRANYHDQTLELIHTPAGGAQIWNGKDYVFQGADLQSGHYDHVHWAMDQGGWLEPGMSATNFTSKPEPVFTGGQWKTLQGASEGGDHILYVQLPGMDTYVEAQIVKSNQRTASALRRGRGRTP